MPPNGAHYQKFLAAVAGLHTPQRHISLNSRLCPVVLFSKLRQYMATVDEFYLENLGIDLCSTLSSLLVWLSGNTLDSINVIALCQACLVPAPQCRTRHQGLLSLGHPSMSRSNEYPAKAGEYTGTSCDTLAPILGLEVWPGA